MDWEKLTDDATIANDAELWRRIHPDWVVPDENTDRMRVSSAAFDNSPDGSPTSVWLATIVRETGRSDADVLGRFEGEGYRLASLTAGQARECKQRIARNPLPDEPAHAFLVGKKTKGAKKCLARIAKWVISPE